MTHKVSDFLVFVVHTQADDRGYLIGVSSSLIFTALKLIRLSLKMPDHGGCVISFSISGSGLLFRLAQVAAF